MKDLLHDLVGLVGGACDSWCPGCEFEPRLGHRDYLRWRVEKKDTLKDMWPQICCRLSKAWGLRTFSNSVSLCVNIRRGNNLFTWEHLPRAKLSGYQESCPGLGALWQNEPDRSQRSQHAISGQASLSQERPPSLEDVGHSLLLAPLYCWSQFGLVWLPYHLISSSLLLGHKLRENGWCVHLTLFTTVLLRYNSYAIKFTLFKYTVQLPLVHAELSNHQHYLISEYFHDPEGKPQLH